VWTVEGLDGLKRFEIETAATAAPAVLVDHMLDAWSASPDTFREDVRAEYAEKFRDPETVHAICEQYRAAATIDYAHDKADKGRRRIHCPLLVLWSEHGFLHENYDPIAIWRDWAEDVKGQAIPAGHFLPEEAPDTTAGLLLDFLLDRSRADCC
jgi:haloacetate dehalogenase